MPRLLFFRLLRYNIWIVNEEEKLLSENQEKKKLSFKEQILRDLEELKTL